MTKFTFDHIHLFTRNPEATAAAFQDGWLFTGDVGFLDKEGYLHLTGRSKDVIVTPAGKNVYPEEVEELYSGIPGVRELCVVGLWDDDVLGETVHAVIVVDREDGKTTVTEETLPAVAEDGAATASVAAAAGLTDTEALPVTEEVAVSVAVMPSLPADFNAMVKVCTPASAAVKV